MTPDQSLPMPMPPPMEPPPENQLHPLENPHVLIERIRGEVDVLRAVMNERQLQVDTAFAAAEESRKIALATYPTKDDFNKLSEQVLVLRTTSDTTAGRTTGSNAMSDLIFKIFPILISSGVLAWQIGK